MSNSHVSASCLCSGTVSMKTSLLSEDVARGHVQPEDSSSGMLAGWRELLHAESRSPFSKQQGFGSFPAGSTEQAVTSLNTSTLYLEANTSSPTATRQVNSTAFYLSPEIPDYHSSSCQASPFLSSLLLISHSLLHYSKASSADLLLSSCTLLLVLLW